MKRQAFMLSELLIALAILGLIAAFTIPKVLQNAGQTNEQALLRETLASIDEIAYDAYLHGITTPDRFDWYAPRLNAALACGTDALAEGCVQSGMHSSGQLNKKAFVLHNGAIIYGIATDTDHNQFFEDGDTWFIDINGVDLPNTIGQDQITIIPVRIDSNGNLNQSCNSVNCPNGGASTSLYREVFGLN